jgi:hypothetical protein
MQKIITFRGVRLNQRTINAVLCAERILGFKVRITQGSYNAGGVSASAGTHDGGGALDISVKDPKTGVLFPMIRRLRIRDAFRRVGGAAWLRTPAQSDWPWHVHVIMQGDPDLSSGARKQVTAYRNNRNGLASNGRDDGPRTWVNVDFDDYLRAHPLTPPPVVKPPAPKPPATEEPDVTPAQMTELKNHVSNVVGEHEKVMRRNFARILRYSLQTEDEVMRANDRHDEVLAAGGTEAQALDAMWQVLAPLDAALAQEQGQI